MDGRSVAVGRLAVAMGLIDERGLARAVRLVPHFPGRPFERLLEDAGLIDAPARARLEAALANEELARTEQTAAETELSISRRRYEVGRGIYLEVLDALTALVRARQNVTASLRERGRAEADYLYSVGRLP